MELDVQNQQLGLELRDAETMEVSFGLLDLKKDELVWDDLGFESGWWTGLSGLHRGYMLFYTYEDQQNPELKNAFAMDVQEREVLWAYSGYNHLAFRGNSSIGFSQQEEERFYASIELSSGVLSSLSDEEGTRLLKEGSAEEGERTESSFPVQYAADSPHFQTVQSFLEEHFGIKAVGGCEYLEIFDKIIISYYTANREMLSNFILVCDLQAEMLLHEKIYHAGGGIALDTFFVAGKKLIYTKEKRTIECYEIF